MKFELKPLKESKGEIGLDPVAASHGTRTDVTFFDWIAGEDPNAGIGVFVMWLLDELKEEKNHETLQSVLTDWKSSCSEEEFTQRIKVLSRLMPTTHPFHAVKTQFEA